MKYLILLAALRLDLQHVDECDLIEINEFGEQPRTALIFRDADRSIVDWKWSTEKNAPVFVRPGLWVAMWIDEGKLRTVYARKVRWTRTKDDRELSERSRLPEANRRRLSK